MSERSAASITPDDVPAQGDADRKRVLNVLAQRRYRQRKREKLAELEALAASSTQGKTRSQAKKRQSRSAASMSAAVMQTPSDTSSDSILVPCEDEVIDLDGSEQQQQQQQDSLSHVFDQDPMFEPLFDISESFPEEANFDAGCLLTNSSPTAQNGLFAFAFDSSADNPAPDLNLFLTSSPSTSSDEQSTSSLSSSTQTIHRISPSTPTLSPDTTLDIPVLKLLQASLHIATLLGCESTLFDPLTSRPLLPSSIPNLSSLPPNLLPTPAQQAIPHHPIIDILPWASVRARLTVVLSLPLHLRPPAARDPLAVIQIAYDAEDLAEGCKIVGGTVGLREEEWEVGNAFFRNWWWALDRAVVENTNRLRRSRGEPALRIEDARREEAMGV